MKIPNRNKRKVFINTFHMTLGSLIEKVFFFLITVLIARYLSVEHYGEYTTALGLASFFSLFANLNMNIPIIRAINLNKEHQNEYFTGSLLIKAILSVLIYISLIITLQFTGYNRNIILLCLILGVVRIGSEFISTLYSFYEAKEKFNVTAIMLSAFSSLFLLGTIVVILLHGDYYQLVYVRFFITVFFLILFFFSLKKTYIIKYNLKISIEFIKDLLPFSGSFALQNIILNCGLILLPLMHGSIYAGVYQNAFLIAISTTFIHSNLARVLIPFLYKYPFHDNKDKFQFTFDIYSKIFGIISFYLLMIFFIYSPNIIFLIFGNKYNSSVQILKIFSFMLPIISVAQTIITTVDKQKINTLFDTISAFSNIILSYILIYYFKAEGAAIAFVITMFLIYVMTNGYLVKKKYIIFRNTFKIYSKLLLLSIIIYIFHLLLSFKFQFFVSIIIDSLIYTILVICFILKKDDIRIIKEIFSRNKSLN